MNAVYALLMLLGNDLDHGRAEMSVSVKFQCDLQRSIDRAGGLNEVYAEFDGVIFADGDNDEIVSKVLENYDSIDCRGVK